MYSAISEMPGAASASLNGRPSRRAGDRPLELLQRDLLAAALDLRASGAGQLSRARSPASSGASSRVLDTKLSIDCSAAPESMVCSASRTPSSRVARPAGHEQRGAGVEHHQRAARARLALEHGARDLGVLAPGLPPATSSWLGALEAHVAPATTVYARVPSGGDLDHPRLARRC